LAAIVAQNYIFGGTVVLGEQYVATSPKAAEAMRLKRELTAR
jgi:hypothetical protein